MICNSPPSPSARSAIPVRPDVVLPGQFGRRDADAIVLDLEDELAVDSAGMNPHDCRVRVPRDVGQGFLQDAEDGDIAVAVARHRANPQP